MCPFIPETGGKITPKSAYLSTCGLAVTLTSDLLTPVYKMLTNF